ncbi:hypothetical protein AKJ58_00920 [candidate division MSBL1 archaeon SCGC-AAA385D11]|uniref:Radical SAM core domain-containing protein n=1 Tax=candidate division MSBL1 archaeon SCGC-AAA385D11 TaxID=1698286 RepID=A0A133VNV4_9EURY|nr:hypothetical protein AKJ58_00920 [candidate division MSBL1 archaeon SCGC-AAA385D11]
MEEYPRYLTPDSETFDPVELAERTRKIVCRGDERKYTRFYATGVYGGIATGYTCGCCLRCVFCWVDRSRDFPEKLGSFYSPREAFERLSEAARSYGTRKLRISGAEPTLCKDHLIGLLDRVEDSEFGPFILETNGIPFGVDEDYVEKISEFDKPHVRVSLKAGTPEAFSRKTGAKPQFFEIPFKAIRNLLKHGVSFHVAGMMDDPRIVTSRERSELARRLKEIHPKLLRYFEGEVVDPYESTIKRLKASGFSLSWPLKESYPPLWKEYE